LLKGVGVSENVWVAKHGAPVVERDKDRRMACDIGCAQSPAESRIC